MGYLKNLHNISENINGISTNFDEISVIFHQKKPSSPFDIVKFSLKFLLNFFFHVRHLHKFLKYEISSTCFFPQTHEKRMSLKFSSYCPFHL